jgi:hypothetical protein
MARYIIIILISFISSCNSDSTEQIREEVAAIAEEYALGQLKDAKKTVLGNGTIIISDQEKRYIIDPSKIIVTLIDDDQVNDAVIPVTSFIGKEPDLVEHLFIINTDGKLMLIRTTESDMKILQIRDRVITTQQHTKPRTSPLYNCASCQEIVNYRFINGDLVKIEQEEQKK